MSKMVAEEPKVRVNGATVSSNMQKPVCLVGTVLQVDASGMNVKLRAPDNQVVDVRLQEPVSSYAEGLMEVVGKVSGRNSIAATNATCFPKEMASAFDLGLYNEAVQLINKYPDYYPSFKSLGGAF